MWRSGDSIGLPRGSLAVRFGPFWLAVRRRGHRLLYRWVLGNVFFLPSAAVVVASDSLFGYREPKGETVFVFV